MCVNYYFISLNDQIVNVNLKSELQNYTISANGKFHYKHYK